MWHQIFHYLSITVLILPGLLSVNESCDRLHFRKVMCVCYSVTPAREYIISKLIIFSSPRVHIPHHVY
jgi:hypothetical protein